MQFTSPVFGFKKQFKINEIIYNTGNQRNFKR